MKSVKKIFYSVLAIIFLNMVLIKNCVYADVVGPIERITYTPLYYIAIIVVIAIVVGMSIWILRKIYKNNQLDKEENKENEKGEEK